MLRVSNVTLYDSTDDGPSGLTQVVRLARIRHTTRYQPHSTASSKQEVHTLFLLPNLRIIVSSCYLAPAIPPPNGLPKRDMDGNELKTPAPSVLPASPPGTLTAQQAQNLTTTASTTVNNMATPPPVVSAPAGTATPPTGPVTESPSNKVPPPLPDAPRPQLLAPPEPKKAPPVPKKPIPNPATPAKDAIRPNPVRPLLIARSGKLG